MGCCGCAPSRSSSSATSSSASKPDPDDVEEEEEFEPPSQQTIVPNPSRLQRVAPRTLKAPTPMQKSQQSYNLNNESPSKMPMPTSNRTSRLTMQSPAIGRRNSNNR